MKTVKGEQVREILPSDVIVNILGPCIEYFNNIISLDDANFIISSCEEANNDKRHPWKFEDAKVGNHGEINNNVRSNKTMGLDPNIILNSKHTNSKKVLEILHKSISASVRYYSEKYDVPIAADEGFILLKYQTGNEYKPHMDAGIAEPFCSRTLSMVAYLNPTEYDGGDTYFNNFNISVKPNNTGLVLFPSNYAYIHQAMPVKSGTKYAIVTWLSMPKSL